MKKLISSILALSLVAGMSVTAFAADGDAVGFMYTPADVTGINQAISTTYTVSIPYDDIGVVLQGNDGTDDTLNEMSDSQAKGAFNISSTAGSTKWTAAASSVVGTTVQSISAVNTSLDIKLKAPTSNSSSGTTFSVDITLTALGTDNTSSAVGNATGYTTGAKTFTIDGTYTGTVSGLKISDVRGGSGNPIGELGKVTTSGMGTNYSNADPNVLGNLDIQPDSDIKLYLMAGDFDWENNAGDDMTSTVSDYSKVTNAQLRNGKITVKKSVSKGSNVIDTVEFDSDNTSSYVKIEFIEWFVSVNEQDVDFTIYLAYKGSKRSDTQVTIAGTMENEQDEVDEGDDYISTEDGTVFEAQDYVRNCEVYLGNGVYITTNLFKDKKYYGIALNTYDTTDGAIMDEYPEIDNVLTLKTVNLKGSGNIVTFDMSGDYYVYGADGTYLGLSSEAVPYSDKYYFATERISINDGDLDDDDDLILDEDDDDDYVGPSDGGGDDANNANDNPGTGVNGFVGVAVAAGLISLAAVGVTARKKK